MACIKNVSNVLKKPIKYFYLIGLPVVIRVDSFRGISHHSLIKHILIFNLIKIN